MRKNVMKKGIVLSLIVTMVSVITTRAQIDAGINTNGIHFEQTLKWNEILAKAKAEHKYIFVDCYATWCAPCKLMDDKVYPIKEVGEVYNANFISVRVQMDKIKTDDDHVKEWYNTAEKLEKDYHVDAYPTFLFFDTNGNPVHKAAGYLPSSDFVKLASDAQNPDKQYYAILKDFKVGKIDTSEEKSLPLALLNTDRKLASKLAADYLSRIPESRLATYDSGRLMWLFQDDPQVADIAAKHISLYSKKDILKNGDFIAGLSKQQKIEDIAIHYITSLNQQEISQRENQDFIERFRDDPKVRQVAQRFVATLPENERYNKPIIFFIDALTYTTHDEGFKFFYRNVAHIDTVVKGDQYAQGSIKFWISNTEWQPQFEVAKKTGFAPNFEEIKIAIAKKFDKSYSEKIITDARIDWYGYLVNEKKEGQYWPQMIGALVDRDKSLFTGNTSIPDVNNDCWTIYQHGDDTAILKLATSWMAEMAKDKAHDAEILDTYASILYKSGQPDQAVLVEENAVKEAYPSNPGIAKGWEAKIDAMKRNEKIWLEPAYQN